MSLNDKPVPTESPLSQPYWDAARSGQLVIQRCTQCGKFRHYPRLLCDACYSKSCEFVPVSGSGVIHSWTVTHHVFHRAFTADVPYVLLTVDLSEGVRALGRWDSDHTLAIGLPVRACFHLDQGAPELRFHPR